MMLNVSKDITNKKKKNISLKYRTELGQIHMVKSFLSIPNPWDQKDIQEQEKP